MAAEAALGRLHGKGTAMKQPAKERASPQAGKLRVNARLLNGGETCEFEIYELNEEKPPKIRSRNRVSVPVVLQCTTLIISIVALVVAL